VFPFDYRSGEFGDLGHYNLSGFLIDFFASQGWVWDRKKVSDSMIARRALKTGDGSHYLSHDEAHKNSVYGFGDKDMDEADRKELEAMQG
jgi:stearoyl-CoA desaturase (delta-9 desaturase)